ncbi:hypothetical protein [Campylobacter sp. MG1]|uniref:hypothetical protein n=1 Tax=Campylobacter sp. MG1 TaxID=2976332 RepID=UPI00226C99FD|nr:hypothetical protein [Campylobacter sp. MG1]
MKYLILFLMSNMLYANNKIDFSNSDTILLFSVLSLIILLLVAYLVVLKLKLKTKKINIFDIKNYKNINNTNSEKLAIYFDLQEVFLYFFKTLNYEASVRNNIILVQQDMMVFDRNNNKKQPLRYFLGDYTDIINAIWLATDLINQNVENETIFIEIKIENLIEGRTILMIDIGLCGILDNKKTELFKNFKNPKNLFIGEQISKFRNIINNINDAKYVIKDSTQRINDAICISIPLVTAKNIDLLDVTPSNKLQTLIIHNNQDVAKTIVSNLESFNIGCIHNQTIHGLLDKIEDGVNCVFRAIFIDALQLNLLNDDELNTLIKNQEIHCFKIIVILNNHKIPDNIENVIQYLEFLPIPYTIDNIRSIVNIIKSQEEKLLG